MRETGSGTPPQCDILPFDMAVKSKLPQKNGKAVAGKTSTTMAALLAVTIRHDASISAEERLIQIIESSGEAEILETEEALADMGFDSGEIDKAVKAGSMGTPANDNAPMSLISGR